MAMLMKMLQRSRPQISNECRHNRCTVALAMGGSSFVAADANDAGIL